MLDEKVRHSGFSQQACRHMLASRRSASVTLRTFARNVTLVSVRLKKVSDLQEEIASVAFVSSSNHLLAPKVVAHCWLILVYHFVSVRVSV